MLPGKAIKLPRPSRLRSKLAQNANANAPCRTKCYGGKNVDHMLYRSAFASGNRYTDKASDDCKRGENTGKCEFLVVLFCFIVEFSFLLNKKGLHT